MQDRGVITLPLSVVLLALGDRTASPPVGSTIRSSLCAVARLSRRWGRPGDSAYPTRPIRRRQRTKSAEGDQRMAARSVLAHAEFRCIGRLVRYP